MSVTSIAHDLPIGHIKQCQICATSDLELVIDLGHHAPCDSLLTERQLHDMERTYPLRFMRCLNCGLAQIDYVVPREILFYPEYPYRSGITETLKKNLHAIAQLTVEKLGLAKGSLVIDIGSNDGTILEGFKSAGMKVLGVEPTNIAQIAIENGIETINDFFSEEIAEEIRSKYGEASLITGANIFAHIPNLGSFIRGSSKLLRKGGVFITESHYLLNLLKTVQYDSIYHEHLRYYSLKPMIKIMNYYGFSITDAERIPNYGGSIRVYAAKEENLPHGDRLQKLLEEEEKEHLYGQSTYDKFRERTVQSKLSLQSLLLDLKNQGKDVVGIGCPGRSSTLINYCDIDSNLMPYIAEQSTSLKLGLYLPMVHIPIIDEKIMFQEQPEYALMLSWHYAAPIIKNLRKKGLKSKIIIPLPEVHIFEG